MASNKLVDSDLIAKLLEGSFELQMVRMDDLVHENEELFGGNKDTQIQTMGTFAEHAIVVNSDGQFFRATFKNSQRGLELGEVEEIDVPVFEAKDLRVRVHEHTDRAVAAIMEGKDAHEDILAIYDMVHNGVPLTAESVEESLLALDDEVSEAINENRDEVTRFVGVMTMEPPSRRFAGLIEDRVSAGDRKAVVHGLRSVRSYLADMSNRLVAAHEIDESYSLPGDDDGEEATGFIEMAEDVGSTICALRGIVEDAIAVSDDGSVKSLARIHDGVAGRLPDLTLATLFAEKFAGRFVSPRAA